MIDEIISKEQLASFAHRYYLERKSLLKDFERLPSLLEENESQMEKYPQAKGFLEMQKETFHAYSLEKLKNRKIGLDPFGYAKIILYELCPDNLQPYEVQMKQMGIIDKLEACYESNETIAQGVSALILLLQEQELRVAFSPSELERLEINNPTLLDLTQKDEEFLEKYLMMTHIQYKTFAGLSRFKDEPVEDVTSEMFYSDVADFYLFMLDGIIDLEQDLKEERRSKMA